MSFLKQTLAVIVGVLIFSVIGLWITYSFILKPIVNSAQSASEPVRKNSVLRIDLNKSISELPGGSENPFDQVSLPVFGSSSSISLLDLRAALKNAATDSKIEGIVLNLGSFDAGYAILSQLRRDIDTFRVSGKFVFAYSERLSEKGVYLASAAERIFLNPAGDVEFNGLSAEIMFYKKLLDKWGVKPTVFKVGTFKSAVEPYLLDKMSDANRLQVQTFLNSIYDAMLEGIARSRSLHKDSLRYLSDNMIVSTPQLAVSHKLITDLGYWDEVLDLLVSRTSVDKVTDLQMVSLNDYVKSVKVNKSSRNDRIAVIIAEGEIVDGKGDEGQIGSQTYALEIRKARLNDKVKAVVIRINSPGGSALASDVMWREIQLTSKVKPVIASMGDVAASGGYYMAMGCDYIFAEPNTITGSIGVFGLAFNLKDLMEKTVGITTDRVSTGNLSTIGSPFKEMTKAEIDHMQAGVDRIYEEFTTKAAQGRKMDIEKLKEVAQGRVWSGTDARTHGLVDAYGGLDDAIKMAAEKANLKDYGIYYQPFAEDFIDKILGKTKSDRSATSDIFLQDMPEEIQLYWKAFERLKRLKGIKAMMPYELIIQ